MSGWVRAFAVEDCPVGEVREVIVDGQILAVAHLDHGFYVLDGICLHQGGPLGRGTLVGCHVVCPWHGWMYDVTTGCHSASPTVKLSTWPTQLRDGAVWVALRRTSPAHGHDDH